MYKLHINIIILIFLIIFIVSIKFKLDYISIANETISVTSILLGIYGISITSIINSGLALNMKNKGDCKLKGKSELGVLIAYYKSGIVISFLTIFFGVFIPLMFKSIEDINWVIYYSISSIGISLFFLNFICIYFVFKFIFNVQIRE